MVRGKNILEKWSPGKKTACKKIPRSPERRSPEKMVPEKSHRKIVLRQRNARKFDRLFEKITIILAPNFATGFIMYRRKETELQVVKIKIRSFSLIFVQFLRLIHLKKR